MKIILPSLHARQREVRDSAARFKVLSCGRRWGKTRLGSALCIAKAIEGKRSWWVAPSYPVASVGWRMVKRLAQQIPDTEIRQGDRMILTPTGGEVRVRSADNPDSLRGEGLDFVVMDECAFMKEAAWLEAIRPALSDRHGGAMFISTPKGRNWFWRTFQHAKASDSGEWEAWQLPSVDNPYMDAEEIEAARLGLPEKIFQQEYLAQFLEGEGQVFRNVYANMTSDGRHHCSSPDVVAGVDWGKLNDYTVISVGCRKCNRELHIDRFNKIDYHYQRERLKVIFDKYKVRYILAESNSIGEPNIEALLRDGLPVEGFTTTSATKQAIIENLALSLERETVAMVADEVGTAELEAYEMTVSSSGRPRFNAPEGLHDDTVIARALMLHAITSYRPAVY